MEKWKKEIQNIDQKYKKILCTILKCFTNQETIKFYDGYSSMISKAKYKTTKERRLKILTSKQMLQRLPIALAQEKAGNNSENYLMKLGKLYVLYINLNK